MSHFALPKAVSNRNICFIRAVLLWWEHRHFFLLIFLSHGSICSEVSKTGSGSDQNICWIRPDQKPRFVWRINSSLPIWLILFLMLGNSVSSPSNASAFQSWYILCINLSFYWIFFNFFSGGGWGGGFGYVLSTIIYIFVVKSLEMLYYPKV